jgi:AcrR family transcriptional regulator
LNTTSDEETDGRRRRSQDSRARIVAAMLELTRQGEVSPSATAVAERAGVGLRSVFRHFKDMESLYQEMSITIEGELRAVAEQPFRTDDWTGAAWRSRWWGHSGAPPTPAGTNPPCYRRITSG